MTMLSGAHFLQANDVLRAPPGQEDKVYDLPILRLAQPAPMGSVVSCWRLSRDQQLEVFHSDAVYLQVIGRTHPPLALFTSFDDVLRTL